MGRLEKVVVLTVLFLVAVILGISLNEGGGASDPVDEVLASETLPGPARAPVEEPVVAPSDVSPRRATTSGDAAAAERPRGLLSATLESGTTPTSAAEAAGTPPASIVPTEARVEAPEAAGAPAVEAPASAPGEAAAFLVSEEGLAPSRAEDLALYTWREGDSFTALAERYYGSRKHTGRLLAANEGRDETSLRAGDRIFVPSRPAQADERLQRSSQSAGQWMGGVYVVQSGDMLGTIAQKVYGSAARWRTIYDANRDVLESPDTLKVGTRLRIPE